MPQSFEGALANIPFMGGMLGQRRYNEESSANATRQLHGNLGNLAQIQQQQQAAQVHQILAQSQSLDDALPKLMQVGPLGIQVAHQLSTVEHQQQQTAQGAREATVFSPANIAANTTPGQPAQPAIPAGLDELGGGPGRPAQPAMPGQVNMDALRQQSMMTSPRAFEAGSTHIESTQARNMQILQMMHNNENTFQLRMQQARNQAEREAATADYRRQNLQIQQGRLDVQRQAADPFGMSNPSAPGVITPPSAPAPAPTAAISPQPLPQPVLQAPGGNQVSPVVQAQRDQQAAAIQLRETQPNGGGAIPTNRVIPESAPPPTAPQTQAPIPGVTAPPTEGPHGEEFLKRLPPNLSLEVKAYAEGRKPMPSGFALKSPYFQQLMQAVNQYDPRYSATRYQVRQDFVKGGQGSVAGNITALDQALNHMGTLDKLATALENNDIPLANTIGNAWAKQTGRPQPGNYKVAQMAVGTELMRVFRQVNASEVETKEWMAAFPINGSPAQIHQALGVGAQLLGGRVNALDNRWNNGMDVTTGYPNMMSPQARATLEKLGGIEPQQRRASDQPSDIRSQADAILRGSK